jgi:competence protein ComEC
MAELTERAPSMGNLRLQTSMSGFADLVIGKLEHWLELERDQLPLWLPVLLGAGVAAWFVLPTQMHWAGLLVAMFALFIVGALVGGRRRLGFAIMMSAVAVSIGCSLVWWRANAATSAALSRPLMATFSATVARIEQRGNDKGIRLLLAPINSAGLPMRVRVSAKPDELPIGLRVGEIVQMRARLMPPAEAMVPGAYDFARVAWFQGLGATGKVLGRVTRVSATGGGITSVRDTLSRHIGQRLPGSAGGIATALVTGDRGAISAEDEDAMRNSGLAHLLSISGLHITAVVAAVMVLTLRLLALSPWLALRWPLVTLSAAAGAFAGVAYTILTGSEVPTIRSCIAALLILLGLAIGREALTLRLVATGALLVLLLWPESVVGPSFQLSFAAITAIVALHENNGFRRLVERRDEGIVRRSARAFISLLVTGLVVEIVLAPIALFHFHKAGLYGALANIIAIPLTTFVIMPLEALALMLDAVDLGDTIWWLVGNAVDLLLTLANWVSNAPGAVASIPDIPIPAFAAMVVGGLWIVLWRTKFRLLGVIPLIAGGLVSVMTSPPDILITGDGRHVAIRTAAGGYAILRDRAGEYVRDTLAERAGFDGDLSDLATTPEANCSMDICSVRLSSATRSWRVVATRSRHSLAWESFVKICAEADIVVSDRVLPKGCRPRWFKADKRLLSQTGGLALVLNPTRIEAVKTKGDQHPWISTAPMYEKRQIQPQYRRSNPANLP